MAIASSCFTTAFLFETIDSTMVDSYIAWPILNIGQKTQMWAYYDGYQKARMNCINYKYANSINQLKFEELAFAPWKKENVTRPSVWVPVLAATIVSTAVHLLTNNGSNNAIWENGEAYLGEQKVPIPIGILSIIGISLINNTFTAIGEEAVFRGIGYEEFKYTMGDFPALMLDSVLFSAMHVPSEVQKGDSLKTILMNSSFRMGITLGLDYAYDDGGLEASVAEHMWIDMFLHLISYLFSAGVPQK